MIRRSISIRRRGAICGATLSGSALLRVFHFVSPPSFRVTAYSLPELPVGIGPKQQVDIILANPPFGAGIAEGVETNFPQSYRCRESADLFVILMIQLLKPGGRAAIVLPDGCITGDGYKERIREKLLTDCNLHTIVRLPQSTFHPANVSTNLLFFEKGTPTKDIWYYEHALPDEQKSYSKTKPIQFEEFAPMIEWWDNREENEVAWKVTLNDLKKGFDLNEKNPNSTIEQREMSVAECLKEFRKSLDRAGKALTLIEKEYSGR
jgi:type I restriction enzyme M protein